VFGKHKKKFLKKMAEAEQKTPVFILKYGPPGSGKSSCSDAMLQDAAQFGNVSDLLEINVDDIVAQLSDVKKKFDPDEYQRLRKVADKMADTLLKEAINQKKSASLEMTGRHLDEKWLKGVLVGPMRQKEYKLLVMYPLAPLRTLLERNKLRGQEIGREADELFIERTVYAAAFHLGQLLPFFDAIFIYDNRSNEKCAHKVVKCRSGQCIVQLPNEVKSTLLECPQGQCRFGLSGDIEKAMFQLYGVSPSLQNPLVIYMDNGETEEEMASHVKTAMETNFPFILTWKHLPAECIFQRIEYWGFKPLGGGGNKAHLFFIDFCPFSKSISTALAMSLVRRSLVNLIGDKERLVLWS
jgi:predicted ABC-type ATPase